MSTMLTEVKKKNTHYNMSDFTVVDIVKSFVISKNDQLICN